jgi:hypothetical protein
MFGKCNFFTAKNFNLDPYDTLSSQLYLQQNNMLYMLYSYSKCILTEFEAFLCAHTCH